MTGTLLIHSLNVATEGSLTLYTCPMWQWMNCPEILRSWRARQSRVLLCIPQTTISYLQRPPNAPALPGVSIPTRQSFPAPLKMRNLEKPLDFSRFTI